MHRQLILGNVVSDPVIGHKRSIKDKELIWFKHDCKMLVSFRSDKFNLSLQNFSLACVTSDESTIIEDRHLNNRP